MFEFKIPEVGENIEKGNVVSIAVSVGDTVKKDQDLLELETDKATIPVPSPMDGVIKEILIKAGDDVQIGQVVMKIDGEASGAQTPKKEDPKATKEPPAKKEAPKEEAKEETKQEPAKKEPPKTAAVKSSVSASSAAKDVPAAPSVRRFAREIGLEITQIPGSGKGGRISMEDVKAFAKQRNTSGAAGSAGAVPASRPLPSFEKYGKVERVAMNNIRKKTAQHLSYCWNTIPHVTQFDKADVTELEKLRKKYSTKERKLTITPFLMKVMASALKTFPQFNASIDMDTNEIIYKKYFNIGVAVDTDRGLLVPVVRDVDKKSIFELADELNEMAQRARDKKTGLDELSGGCITLTNLGGIGGTSFTPIVNWPEVSILGVSRGRFEPVLVDGKFVSRLLLPLSLSYDHRVIDGADGARFTRWVCDAIEQPFMMDLQG